MPMPIIPNLTLKMKQDKGKILKQDPKSGEDDSSSSEDDENAELLTEELEEGFFKVLSQLKKKDSKLYEGSISFFPGNPLEDNASPGLKTAKKKKKSHKEYREWLKGQKEKVENEEVKEELEALHDFWTSPKLNKDEAFLRDYILNKKFLEPDDNFNIDDEINKLSEEEKEVEEQILFEHKYNSRFENPDQDLEGKEKAKTKSKKHKDKELHEHNVSFNVNDATKNEENTGYKTDIDTLKKKRKKKRKHSLENQVFEEVEKNNKVMKLIKKEDDEENLRIAQCINTKKNKNVTEEDFITEKSPKRKIQNSMLENESKSVSNISNGNINQIKTLHSKAKIKRKRNRHRNTVGHISENVKSIRPKDKQKPIHNLPRNLQMKNEKRKIKMRHRNRKKAQLMEMDSGASLQTDSKIKDDISHKTVLNPKKMVKQWKHHNDHNHFDATNMKNNIKTKKNKHFQRLIVKEKKNKEMKFSKIKSKKQKAAKL